tara:strand:- start:12750 stop:13040 length:291 start_codon:yes stop_codon:yes gene_type:complete
MILSRTPLAILYSLLALLLFDGLRLIPAAIVLWSWRDWRVLRLRRWAMDIGAVARIDSDLCAVCWVKPWPRSVGRRFGGLLIVWRKQRARAAESPS